MGNSKKVKVGQMTNYQLTRVRKAVCHNGGYGVEVDVISYLSEEVVVIDSAKNKTTYRAGYDSEVGELLIIRIKVRGNGGAVKINAGLDYSEEYECRTLERYRNHCAFNVEEVESFRGNCKYVEYYLIFSRQQLIELDMKVDVVETGMTVFVEEKPGDANRRANYWKEKLVPEFHPVNNVRSSGLVVVGNDPGYHYQRLYYRVGGAIFRLELDRDLSNEEGVHIGSWNQLNVLHEPVENKIDHMSFEEALSGDHPSGFKVYKSIGEAKADSRKESEWTEKETKAKLYHQWVKIGVEFVKNLLPASITIGKMLLAFFGKSKGIP